ncbi:hypothetical protein KUM39_04985 [Streptomyces sp. J2-1]|uniref:hypothetical protein n=1 Tax=Streptomyces corallincola TaxID=2851888 RepID=UPI001C38259C|nr:hypothetical protein [Streptomyces corallincola]MBV2353719.1 hypothetical protein [Streptomyces corallincola]
MSETSTTQPLSTDAQDVDQHGRHRGALASQEGESAPRGRHRKPTEQGGEAEAA